MDSESLTFLLRGGHFSISERIERGIWPHAPLRFSDLVIHLAKVIETEKWFPVEWEPLVPGKAIREGGIIETKSKKEFIYRYQRHHPINPTVLAEKGERTFSSSKKVAEIYLKNEFHLPGDLDGWTII